MNELLFLVEEADDGSFRAQAVGEAIHTEADTLEDLRREIRDAVLCHFEEGATPSLLLPQPEG
jgi:predicted RNase H-like HicB family nuclease